MRSIALNRVLSLAAIAMVVSCGGGGSNTTTQTQTIAKYAGDNQSAAVLTAVTTKPAIRIVDQNSAGVSGVQVTFAIASGGGAVTGGTVTTGGDGVATVGNWILGATAGANTLTASATGVTGSPVTFTATATAVNAPVPAAITKVAGDAQTAAVQTAVATPPAIKVVDNAGAPIANVPVFFTVASGGGTITGGGTATAATINTNASGVAAVGSWTLGGTAGANTLTATIAGNGITGNPATFTATATTASFSPTANTSISGTLTYSSINIPAGVTVTLSADATITASGNVTVAGTISGNCVNLTMTITGAFSSSGNISNGCTTTPIISPAVTIIAQGGYNVTGGTFTLGGSLNLTNDGTLTDAIFPVGPAPTIRTGASLSSRVGVCSVAGASFVAMPPQLAAGADGTPNGADGKDASTWVLQCTGELDINGGLHVFGQNGGPGGNGTHTSAAAAVSRGGNGGKGGTIKVRSNNGDLVFSGTGNTIQSGDGGPGGNATATGTTLGNPGSSATATGGNGSGPGLVGLQAKGGGISINTAMTLTIGKGGNGGAATSVAANGQNATPCPAGLGGAAAATGGVGGSTADKTLTATGSVGGTGNVTVTGGNPGTGGAATATGGIGGTGAQTCKQGGTGGAITATGGQGGDALLKDANGVLVANGGNGGASTWIFGKGGLGWSDCLAIPEAGGVGGTGGASAGTDGAGGSGKVAGLGGSGTYNVASDGGTGGDGIPPGTRGLKGANNSTLHRGPGTTLPPSFLDGADGAICAVQIVPQFNGLPNTGGVVAPGTYTVPINDPDNGSIVVGSIAITALGPANSNFVGSSPDRLGDNNNSGWLFDLSSAVVRGVPYVITEWTVTFLNANIDVNNPATIEQLDALGNVIGSETITSPTLRAPGSGGFLMSAIHVTTILPNAKSIRVKAKSNVDHRHSARGHRSSN